MEIFEFPLAADGVDPLAYGVGHLAEPGVDDVENCLAGVLDDAFLEALNETFLTAFDEAFFETFLKSFFKGEFFEEGNVGHGCVG